MLRSKVSHLIIVSSEQLTSMSCVPSNVLIYHVMTQTLHEEQVVHTLSVGGSNSHLPINHMDRT